MTLYLHVCKFMLHLIDIFINHIHVLASLSSWVYTKVSNDNTQSNIVSLWVHTMFIGNYTTSIFVPIKYITPKTYHYKAPFKIYEPVERAFLRTLIVWCLCYKNNMDIRIVNNLNMIINNKNNMDTRLCDVHVTKTAWG
jgi:hypothetical protein